MAKYDMCNECSYVSDKKTKLQFSPAKELAFQESNSFQLYLILSTRGMNVYTIRTPIFNNSFRF